MILDKRSHALICAGFFWLAAALGGGAQAAQVYPGCAQPGPTGKVWYVDPVNGKTQRPAPMAPKRTPGTAWTPLSADGGVVAGRPHLPATRARCCRAFLTFTSSTAGVSSSQTKPAALPSSLATQSS